MGNMMKPFTDDKALYGNNEQTITTLEIAEMMKKMKSVYVVENELGNIKIGVSCNAEGRVKTLSAQGGFRIKNLFYTSVCSNAYKIEAKMHKKFAKNRMHGEWFCAEFSKAVCEVNRMYHKYAEKEPIKMKVIDIKEIEELYRDKKEENLYKGNATLEDINEAAETIMKTYRAAGVDVRYIAETIGNMYKYFGLNIFLPPIN